MLLQGKSISKIRIRIWEIENVRNRSDVTRIEASLSVNF